MPANVLQFEQVTKGYPVYDRPGDRLVELLSLQRVTRHRNFWALRDLTFEVKRGETFCIIGENGAGKSTLLQLTAGIVEPTSGTVTVSGRVSALLELGTGFNPEFTGRENVYLSGAIHGFSNADIDAKYRTIAEFAEIGSFIDQPVKTYSSGMVVRLAFAVAIHVDPEILLVDEALAVGDIYFRQRCMRKVHELRSRGVTILFVSHAMGDVKALGDRTLWLENGTVRAIGPTDVVVPQYLAAMAAKDSAYRALRGAARQNPDPEGSPPPEIVTTLPNVDHRHGNGNAEILGIAVLDGRGGPIHVIQPNSTVVVRITVRANKPLHRPNVGFMLRNHLGVDFAGTNTTRENLPLPPMQPGEIHTVDFYLDLPTLYPSHFSFSPAIADGDLIDYDMCDWVDNAITLQVGHSSGPVYGYVHLPCRVRLNSTVSQEAALG